MKVKVNRRSNKKYIKALRKSLTESLDKPVVLPFPDIASVSNTGYKWDIKYSHS